MEDAPAVALTELSLQQQNLAQARVEARRFVWPGKLGARMALAGSDLPHGQRRQWEIIIHKIVRVPQVPNNAASDSRCLRHIILRFPDLVKCHSTHECGRNGIGNSVFAGSYG